MSCAGISTLSSRGYSDLYSKKFLEQVKIVKNLYKSGSDDLALRSLKNMREIDLFPVERSLRRNLIGVILFGQAKYEQAVFNFDLGLATSRLDKALNAQIYLNLASSYYKLSLMKKAYAALILVDHSDLKIKESNKAYLLKYTVAKELDKKSSEIEALISYLGQYNNLAELKSDSYFHQLSSSFFNLSERERADTLEKFEDSKFLSVMYLAYLEAEKLYYSGDKEKAKYLLEWTHERVSKDGEISKNIEAFMNRAQGHNKMNWSSIGIVLPLSGKVKKFGERALLGIDYGLKKSLGDDFSGKLDLHILDSEASGAVGAYRVRELIQDKQVSIVIGGLFPSEAIKEYRAAKNNGAFFISLSPIFLPREEKDHLLVEIPGSVESQVSSLFTDDMLEKFGKKAAIIYPNTSRGNSYIDEFWRQASLNDVNVTGVFNYNKNQHDYRDPVRKLLNLKFKRERQEELELLTEVHSLEKSGYVKRIQQLEPVINFDWVFIPAFPREAMQLLPSFSYFDAFKLNIIGGPSWRSSSLVKESRKLGKFYFVGDDVDQSRLEFFNGFSNLYSARPKLIEMRANDALQVVKNVLSGESFSTREDLDRYVKNMGTLSGTTGSWDLRDGIWIKNMASLVVSRGKIRKIFEK